MKKRIHVYYSGNVQGVGFRFTAVRVAKAFEVTGWVKNLRDGRVEVMAEAEAEKLERFLDEIKAGPLKYYIRNADVNWQEFKDEFGAFEVKF